MIKYTYRIIKYSYADYETYHLKYSYETPAKWLFLNSFMTLKEAENYLKKELALNNEGEVVLEVSTGD